MTNKDEELFQWAFSNPNRRREVQDKITCAELAYMSGLFGMAKKGKQYDM